MRIAMVTDSYYPTRDGVVASVTIAKEGLERLGHEVVIIAPDPGKEHRMAGVHYLPSIKFKSYPGYFIPIYPSDKTNILRKIDPDVVHIHGMAVMAMKGLIAARNLRIPTVLTFHTMVDDAIQFYSPIKANPNAQKIAVWAYLRWLLRKADAVIGPTASTIKVIFRNGAVMKRTEVIPTGVDINRFNPDLNGNAILERYGLRDEKIALSVGRLSYEKNIPLIINALRYTDNVKLLIGGKGPAKENLVEEAKAAGVSDRVIFVGFIPDDELPQYYAAADLFVSASGFETQGLSVLEAMACGLPAACINRRAFRDVIQDGENGFVFDGGAEECAEAMKKCIMCDDSIRKNARATAESLSIDSCAKKLVTLYESLIKNKVSR